MSSLKELNEYLYEQLEQITNDDLLEDERLFNLKNKQSQTVVSIAAKIIELNKTVITAERLNQEYGLEDNGVLGIDMDGRKS